MIARENVEMQIYSTDRKIDGLPWPSVTTVDVNDIALLVGALGKEQNGRSGHLSLFSRRRKHKKGPSKESSAPWNRWAPGHKVMTLHECEERSCIYIVSEKAITKLMKEQSAKELALSLSAPTPIGAVSLGVTGKSNHIPLSEKKKAELIFSHDASKWARVSQIYKYEMRSAPLKNASQLGAKRPRIWRLLQLAAINEGVAYQGRSLSGLLSCPMRSSSPVIENSTSNEMHYLTALRGRECTWLCDPSQAKLRVQGFINLDENFDIFFKASYDIDGVLQRELGKRMKGQLGDAIYNEVLHMVGIGL